MFQIILTCALLALACGAPQVVPKLDGRIIGGSTVDIEDYPYQLSLQYGGNHICGATLIDEMHAITAAHCTDGATASVLKIRAGSSKHNSGGQVVAVKEIFQHPKYNRNNVDYDITVLRFLTPIFMSPRAQTINLPEEDEVTEKGKDAVVTGWGTTKEGSSSLPSLLQSVSVKIVSNLACKGVYQTITDRMICAGLPFGGKDACQGDSGGPLVCDGKLVGVVSWGYGCARPNYPGVYASVANLRSFVKECSNV